MTSKQVADFVDRVVLMDHKDPGRPFWGRNFAGMERRQVQVDSAREGREVLVLAGIAVGRLSAAEKRHLVESLERRLNDLDYLVRAIDWQKFSESPHLVRRSELREWLEADFPQGLPSAAIDQALVEERLSLSSSRCSWGFSRKLFMALALILGVGCLALLVIVTPMWNHQDANDGHSSEKCQGQPIKPPSIKNDTAKEEDKLYAQLKKELVFNGFAVERLESELKSRKLEGKREKQRFLEEYQNKKRSADGWLFLLPEERYELERLHGENIRASAKDVEKTRDKLKEFGRNVDTFRTIVRNSQVTLEGQEQKTYFPLIKALALEREKGGRFELPSSKSKGDSAWFSPIDLEKAKHFFLICNRIKEAANGQFPKKSDIDDERREIVRETGITSDSVRGRLASQYDALVELVAYLQRFEADKDQNK